MKKQPVDDKREKLGHIPRGGSSYLTEWDSLVSSRDWDFASIRDVEKGFRVVRNKGMK